MFQENMPAINNVDMNKIRSM